MNETTISAMREFSQKAKKLLQKETNEMLEGIYGFLPDGRLEPADKYPAINQVSTAGETRNQLEQYIENEQVAGLNAGQTRQKLIKEVAFTWLNRLIAFKMMETRGLMRQTISRGQKSNGFLRWLTETGNEEDYQRYEKGDFPQDALGEGPRQQAYRNYIFSECQRLAVEVNILFDPKIFPGRFFPRPRILNQLIEMINHESISEAWKTGNDETIGWIYQYFIQDEKEAVFNKIYKQKKKLEPRDLSAATQIFTPRWIVSYLVENTLGRLWLRMHPDSKLREKMDYYVPNDQDSHSIPLKRVKDITMLDPACGTMHFGMRAFDLFYDMYLEEIVNKGKTGWPENPSIERWDDIPQNIVENNIYGIDIDLRSIQLSALSLYIKAKSKERNAGVSRYRLTCTDIPILTDRVIKEFVGQLDCDHRVTKKLLMEILPLFNKAHYLGSLLKVEEVVENFVEKEKVAFDNQPQPVLFEEFKKEEQRQLDLYYEKGIVWDDVKKELVSALDRFSKSHPHTSGAFLAGESVKGLGLIDALIRKHDVVVSNPPYSGKRNWTNTLSLALKQYGKNSGDIYSCFIDRCIDLVQNDGFIGLVTIHTFMFTSSYETIRRKIIQDTAIETVVHLGTRTEFDVANKTAQGFVMYTLQKKVIEKSDFVGIYFRVVKENEGKKHDSFRKGLDNYLKNNFNDLKNYHILPQEKLKVIPSWPFVYWISDGLRKLFEGVLLGNVALAKQGLATSDNFRFLRLWWEIDFKGIFFNCISQQDSLNSKKKWYPFMKGGSVQRWYGNQEYLINWKINGKELKEWASSLYRTWSRIIKNVNLYFKEGITYSDLTVSVFSARYLSIGFIFDVQGSSIFRTDDKLNIFFLLGLLNSKLIIFLLKILNPTIHTQTGDINKLPFFDIDSASILVEPLQSKCKACVSKEKNKEKFIEASWEFCSPINWKTGFFRFLKVDKEMTILETEISRLVYQLYEIDQSDIDQIESEFGKLPGDMPKKDKLSSEEGETLKRLYMEKHVPAEVLTIQEDLIDEEGEATAESESKTKKRGQKRFLTFEEICLAYKLHPETVYNFIVHNNLEREEERAELAYQWISYAVGIIMGRFQPGIENALGRGEFNEDVALKLRFLVDADAIMVMDEGHSDDLPAKVMEALEIMLGDDDAAQVVIKAAGKEGTAIELLRQFLGNTFFKRHIQQYRKRPVYWLLQSPKQKYGVWLFHERLNKDTLFRIRTEYVEPKKNLVENQVFELKKKRVEAEGREKRELDKRIETLDDTFDDIREFSGLLGSIIEERGYIPHTDDGVLLNMAPLWELIPSWQKEPKNAWDSLEKGEYDWAYQAMDHWPDRVKEKCKTDKSLAIAHGLE